MLEIGKAMDARQKLDDVAAVAESMRCDLSDFFKLMETGEFIPEPVCERLAGNLEKFRDVQGEFIRQFASLEIGVLPSEMKKAGEMLDSYIRKTENIAPYVRAVNFFMALDSEDEATRDCLEKRKENLAGLDFDGMGEEEIRSAASDYLKLMEAFYETDPARKFSYIYELVSCFEEPVVAGIHFGTLRVTEDQEDTPEGGENNDGPEKTPEPEEDSENTNDDNLENDSGDRLEDIGDIGENAGDVSWTEQEGNPGKDDEEWEEEDTPGEVEYPENLVTKEEKELLDFQVSARAYMKFGAKEFKNDMLRQYHSEEKIDCLLGALEAYGYTEESIALRNGKEPGYYNPFTDKLFQAGYLKKYTVGGYGEFYTLSPRGRKVFSTKDSLAFINSHHPRKEKKALENGDRIEDTTNSAIVRILCNSVYAKVRKLNQQYEFGDCAATVGVDYFIIGFPEVLDGKGIIFFGIVSENPLQFTELWKSIKKIPWDDSRYVAVGTSSEMARLAAEWVSGVLGNDLPIWYGGYSDDVLSGMTADEKEKYCAKEPKEDGVESIKDPEPAAAENADESDMEEMPAGMEEETAEGKTDGLQESAKEKHPDELQEETGMLSLGKDPEELPERTQGMDLAWAEAAATREKWMLEEKETVLNTYEPLSENDKADHDRTCWELLASQKFYAAAAYLKSLALNYPEYRAFYRQLAYALNDPMENCSYSSDMVLNVYFGGLDMVSEYFVVAASLRNYFLDQFSYDYSLQQLRDTLASNSVLREDPALEQILYTLQRFKTEHHCGIDRYADYRERERAAWETRMENTRKKAGDYYRNYSVANVKENASHKRFIETSRLLLGASSDLGGFLKAVDLDNRDMVNTLEEFLARDYVKDHAVICKENIDPGKIDKALDEYWDLALNNIKLAKKSSDLMSSLRMNLFKKVHKVVSVLCDYVSLLHSSLTNENDSGRGEYGKAKASILRNIDEALLWTERNEADDLPEAAGKAVLSGTLHEIKMRLDGSFREGSSKYFYIDFLKNDKVLLDEDFFPILDPVAELPDFSVRNRILEHCRGEESPWDVRLNEIFSGGDDYGSAERILEYLHDQGIQLEDMDYQSFSMADAAAYAEKDMGNKRKEFVEDLELAQSYGQIDNTAEDSKEILIQIMETWYSWALETRNYGFFARILEKFREKVRRDAQNRAAELEKSLKVYLEQNPQWEDDERQCAAVAQIQERITAQNYAAAEDLLNRLITDDLDSGTGTDQTDYFAAFLKGYEMYYRKTANPGVTLKSLINTYAINKDTKGAERLLDYWPKSSTVSDYSVSHLLETLGFNVGTVRAEEPIQGKKSFLVMLKRPENGRKSNYKHPISAFGSEAEEKGFRVVCCFGKMDASRLIDTFREIGNAKNTIILLDYSLTLADRRTLARKAKTDLTGKVFAVIDRVALAYLAAHYSETAVNRMLMYIVMPFASCQPYIYKSADVMPQEMFIGRRNELEKIESPTGVNIVYGGRQLGKTALLRMAKKEIDRNENGDRAVLVNVLKKDYREAARVVSMALYDEGILDVENITEDWEEIARDIRRRLRDTEHVIPYFLLMIDEADMFIESCEAVEYKPLEALKEIQSIGTGRFKFVVAGLRNIVRFKRSTALSNNKGLAHLESLTVRPFKSMEARELLEGPLSYLGFRFPRDNETEILISTIFGTTNYFPGLIQLYCTKMIETMKRDYAGYTESDTPPYFVRKEHIKKVLAEQTLQDDIRQKFFITLKVGDDDYYYIIALLAAYHYHECRAENGCSAETLRELADTFSIGKLRPMKTEQIMALMEEMCELNVLQHTGNGRYRFTRHNFCQMMGNVQEIENELLEYMEN